MVVQAVGADKLASSVTIIIMTYQRPQFLRRMIGALSQQKFAGHVIIADSSTPDQYALADQYIEELTPSFKIKHLSIPKAPGTPVTTSMNQAISAAVEVIDTKYAMLTCDDDYPVPQTLHACAQRLDEDDALGSAVGDYVNLWLSSDHQRDKNRSITLEPSLAIPQGSARERYLYYIDHLFHTMFLLTRSENLRSIVPAETHTITDPHFSADFIWMFVLAVSGPVAYIKLPYIIRQRHEENLNTKQMLPSSLQTLMSPTWTHDANTFVDCVAKRIAEVDGIPMGEAKIVTLQGFGKFFGDRLVGRTKIWMESSKIFKARFRAYRKWRRSKARALFTDTASILTQIPITESLKVYEKKKA